MTDCDKPHNGIELDGIDLSGLTTVAKNSPQNAISIDKKAPKTFIKAIFKKMMLNDPFLSFSTQIHDINSILTMKYSSANDIADVILKDMALTTKLLKLVNSSFYGHFVNKGVATVSEAMIILGTEEIKLAAASLKIYEFMKDIANIKILKNKTLKALQRSIIARQIAIDEELNDAEAIQISAMLYDFGQFLIALFAPDIFIKIEIKCDEDKSSREEASKKMLGISYSELGRIIARKWNLPTSIINAMNPNIDFSKDRYDLNTEELHGTICALTNDLCNIEFTMQGEFIGEKITEVSDKYKQSLEIAPSQSVELLKVSRQKIKTHEEILTSAT